MRTIKFRLNTFAKSFNASRRPGALMEFMLKCAPEKSEGFKTEPFEMSIFTDWGCSSGSEKAKLISPKKTVFKIAHDLED